MAGRRTPKRRAPARAPRPSRGEAGPRIRVVVADSNAIDRGGLVRLIGQEPDLEVVGEAARVDEVIQQCRALKPDALLLSVTVSGQEQGPAIPQIRAALPKLRILALADRGAEACLVLNPPFRREGMELPMCAHGTDCLTLAVQQGAMATLRRSADPEDLFRALRTIAAGSAWYDPATSSAMLSNAGPGGNGATLDLSEREVEVAGLLAEGLSNKEISTALKISEPTVKKHIGHILVKLKVADRLQAGLYIARNPLVAKR